MVVKKLSGTVKGHEWFILESVLDNKTHKEISESIGVKESTVKSFVTKTVKALYQNIETRKLLECHALDAMGKKYSWAPTKSLDSEINRKFVSLLSEADSPVLTEEEMTFCYLLVYEGDAKEALKDSGLAVGLTKSLKAQEYNRLLELRVVYLKSKPNIISYLRELQIKFVDSLSVSKSSIQAELMRTITQLRNQNDPRNAPTIAKLLNDLGRTEGVFVDKTENLNVLSVDDSFNMMIERRKEFSKQVTMDLELSSSGTYVCPGEEDENVIDTENVEVRQIDSQ